jgi:hypothetical protein
LEEFVADPLTAIYNRATGTLVVSASDPLSIIYKQVAGTSAVTGGPLPLSYK